MTLNQMLFSLQGRITRSQFWLYTIGKTVALMVVLGAIIGIGSVLGENGAVLMWVLIIPVYVLFVWASICIQGKRCHDRDKSAWFLLVGIIPLVGLWVLVELGFLDGTQGPNQYGPSPKGIGGDQFAGVFS